MSTIHKLKTLISEVRYNPAAIQRVVYDNLNAVSEGRIELLDPSNPFVFLLESSAVNAAVTMTEAENIVRRLYPSMALTEEELYLHMSDKDYIGRFATPSRTVFTVLIHKEEFVKRAVATDLKGIKKLIIPRDTEFRVSDYIFTMHYPIEIRVMSHGGLQVVYDASTPNPLQTLESNLVDWKLVKLHQDEFIQLKIPVSQYAIKTYYGHINRAISYTRTFKLEDPYYFCRVFRSINKTWHEIKTTHTDQVFDPHYPTALLTHYTNALKVTIPQIYIHNGLLDGELRVDIYTTKGPLELILDGYALNLFTAHWRSIDGIDSKYIAPLEVFSSLAVYSDAVVTGGREPLGFEALRERVIMNALGNAQLPITNVQLITRLENYGYKAIINVDNITNRIYLATKRLPPPSSGNTLSGASSLITPLQERFSELVKNEGVIDNKFRLTLTPDVLFYQDNGVLKLLVNDQVNELYHLLGSRVGENTLINQVNQLNPLYTPFHYVLDISGHYFASRAYYLDHPRIVNREFVEENLSINLQVTTSSVSIYKKREGYLLQVVTKTGKTVSEFNDTQLEAQISFRPVNEPHDVFLTGELIRRGTESNPNDKSTWVFNFFIRTRFDIDSDHHLLLTNFNYYPNWTYDYPTPLTNDFHLVYYINEYASMDYRPLTYRGATHLLKTPNPYSVVHEKIGIWFGEYLEGFWERSRSVIDSFEYEYYQEDVLDTYTQTIYKRDPISGTIDISLNEHGELEYGIVHRVGEIKEDEEGNPLIKHHKGDVILDIHGNPIISDVRNILREVDLFLIDGRYKFVNRSSDVHYLTELPMTVVNWLHNDLKQFREWALEQTDIFLYPLQTIGTAEATVREGELRGINLEQSFTVTFYMSREMYDDIYVRTTLRNTAIEVLSNALTEPRIALNEITRKMTEQVGENAIAIQVGGLGGDLNLTTVTLNEDYQRCSIKKRLARDVEGHLLIEDDINIAFIKHEN